MAEDEDKLDVELAIRVLAHEVAEVKIQAFYLEKQMLEKAKESGDEGFERRYNEWFNKEVDLPPRLVPPCISVTRC